MSTVRTHRPRKRNIPGICLLCFVCLLINIGGSKIPGWAGIPLFLDVIGTALAAALGGFIPGIIVGFLTNIINGLSDYTSWFYAPLSILIAIASAFFAGRGTYRKWYKLPLIVLTFSLIGGGLGSVITWLVYGFNFGTGVSAPLAHRLYDGGGFSMFWAQFSADMLIDLADKTVTVLIVALVLLALPEKLRRWMEMSGWRQEPFSLKERLADTVFTHKRSLRLKIIILVSAVMLVTAAVVTTISYLQFRDASVEEQKGLARGVLTVVAEHIDPDRVDEFLEKGEAAEGYSETKDLFKNMMDSSEYVEYCYAYRIEEDGCHVVFDPDTDEMPGEEAGTLVPFDEAFTDYIPDLLAGRPIEAVASVSEYGWLLTMYEPLYDDAGRCQCYVAVDINLEHINLEGLQFLSRVVSLFLGFFIIILTVALWLVEYNLILPINSMAITANNFAFNSEEARTDALGSIKQLDIHTDDEIENLYDAMVKTTEEVLVNINQMQQQNETISKLQNGLIMVLADMVESRDQNTGDHVRKTAMYTEIIMRQMRKEHIYEDQLTDAFIADVVNSAPLHDVGKIHVPDAILNKPGKLDDDEFEQMKTHTTAGSEIISRAISMVSENNSSYLEEARNLAHYHHEKWNGKGYPSGLQGEEIPLSARIMAVADVFDALVSRRSYKVPFTFEKAMAIIEEGRGTHFDPYIAQAFIDAGDEVRKVMDSHQG